MGQVDALQMVEHVRRRLVDLAVSENYISNSNLVDSAQKTWEGPGIDGGLVSELWVEGAFPGKKSNDSLKTLSYEEIFPDTLYNHLEKRDIFPPKQLLYTHQTEALRIASSAKEGEKPALVITAGTGLGKTEAFLLPMLADLWRNPERRTNGGIRCLILYPMNALVADQVERIYQWLKFQEDHTVFHFTSETPENARQANKRGEPQWERCRMRTREEARGWENHDGVAINQEPFGIVPEIVITNYSMLEYMLSRPQDLRFFGPDLRCIILDEAHLYSGALAAEIMMLLRRLRERCGVSSNEILHIATSATLGGDDKDLRTFVSSLFSVDQNKTYVIRGQHAGIDLGEQESPPLQSTKAEDFAQYSNFNFSTLTTEDDLIENDINTVNELCQSVEKIVSHTVVYEARKKFPDIPGKFLYESLRQAPLIRKIASILADKKHNIISLDTLSSNLFNGKKSENERNATIALLRLSASARSRAFDLPLVPHRLHFLVRAPGGLAVCLNPECSGPIKRKITSIGCIQPLADNCKYCNHILLPIHRCDNCGEWTLAAYKNQETSSLEPGYYAKSLKMRTYYLLTKPDHIDLEEVVVHSETGEIRGFGATGVSLWKAPCESDESQNQQCPTCHSSWSITQEEQQPEWRRTCRSLVGGSPLALSVTAETVLYDLPKYLNNSRNWKPAGGRRLLSFCDSRASAARLGPLLTQQHEMQVVRAAMARCAKKLMSTETADYLSNEVERLEEELNKPEIGTALKQHIIDELDDKRSKLTQAKTGTAFIDFAKLVTQREEINQILDREMAERHKANSYGQSDWKKNGDEIKAHIEGLIANELERPIKKRPSVESVGLIEIVYPGLELINIPPLLEEKLSSNIRNKLLCVWPSFVALLLDTVRRDSCISWSQNTSGREWLGESPLSGRWLTRSRNGWGATAFVGATKRQLRRTFTSNVLSSAGLSDDKLELFSEETLFHVFDQLFDLASKNTHDYVWLRKEDHHQTGHNEDDKAIQLLLDKLSVRVPTEIYRCDATGTIWTHTAFGWAPIEGCLGTLKITTSQDLDQDIRWGRSRREYIDSQIFSVGLWAEEHSAQLAPQENRRLQDLFKYGIRNILSSTTTMELGIDIGGLNGVLLGNVPPGPANHRQRAGRAGRRSDGSAVVVTYSGDSEYDREVFQRFGEFLSRDLRKPTLFSDRKRIIQRHLHAVLLSEFIRFRQPSRTGAMHAYGKMGSFCGINITPLRWTNKSNNKPAWSPNGIDISKDFINFLQKLEVDSVYQNRLSKLAAQTGLSIITEIKNWQNFIENADIVFSSAVTEWKQNIDQLRKAWDEIPPQPTNDISREMAKANSIRHMIRALCEITVIEWMADNRFLPRYGFPINLQRLSIRKAVENTGRDYSEPDERYRLERTSILALREYVPESKVLVGGRVATSRGIRKHWTDSNLDQALGLQYLSLECPMEHIYIAQSPDEVCPRCHNKPIRKQQLVFPRFGYTTAGWEKLPLGTNLERIGKQTVCPTAFLERHEDELIFENFAGIKKARLLYRDEAPLLVRNDGKQHCGFAICTRCGFAMSEVDYGQGRMNLPQGFETHASVFSNNQSSFCWIKKDTTAPVLRNRVLAAKELTDMILIEWPGATSYEYNAVYSLGRAMMLSGSRLLELDERELGMTLMPLTAPNFGIVIYDTAPGGAGHCLELIKFGKQWINTSRKILYVDDEHNARCQKACLDCILDFSDQYSAFYLDRKSALKLLDNAIY